jgi:integrase
VDGRADGAVLTAIRGHRLYAVYHLIALRGLRRGEAAGLRWCDVDLGTGTLVISQQLQQYGGRLEITAPKTPYSARVIALDHTTVAPLRAHRRRQRAEAAASGPGYQASGYVFTNGRGGPLAPTGSPASSAHWPVRPDCRRYGCTICATARPPWR